MQEGTLFVLLMAVTLGLGGYFAIRSNWILLRLIRKKNKIPVPFGGMGGVYSSSYSFRPLSEKEKPWYLLYANLGLLGGGVLLLISIILSFLLLFVFFRG